MSEQACESLLSEPVEGDVQSKTKVRLWGNGIDSIPFRQLPGQGVPDIKSSDSPRTKPQETWDAHARQFDMSDDEDVRAYNRVIQAIGKGSAIHSLEKMEWCDKKNCYVIFLRWVELFMEIPT